MYALIGGAILLLVFFLFQRRTDLIQQRQDCKGKCGENPSQQPLPCSGVRLCQSEYSPSSDRSCGLFQSPGGIPGEAVHFWA